MGPTSAGSISRARGAPTPGRRACHRNSTADHRTWKWRDPTGSHRDEQPRQRINNSDSEEIQESTEEDAEGSESWTDYLIRDYTSVWNQEPRIQKFEEDGSQRDGEAAVLGRGSGIRRFVGQLCRERRNVLERWTAS